MAMEMDFKTTHKCVSTIFRIDGFGKRTLYATCWTEFLKKKDRTSGQTNHSHHLAAGATPYRINIGTNRYEGYMKHAFILNAKHGTNIAFMGNVSLHEQRADYGIKHYDVEREKCLRLR